MHTKIKPLITLIICFHIGIFLSSCKFFGNNAKEKIIVVTPNFLEISDEELSTLVAERTKEVETSRENPNAAGSAVNETPSVYSATQEAGKNSPIQHQSTLAVLPDATQYLNSTQFPIATPLGVSTLLPTNYPQNNQSPTIFPTLTKRPIQPTAIFTPPNPVTLPPFNPTSPPIIISPTIRPSYTPAPTWTNIPTPTSSKTGLSSLRIDDVKSTFTRSLNFPCETLSGDNSRLTTCDYISPDYKLWYHLAIYGRPEEPVQQIIGSVFQVEPQDSVAIEILSSLASLNFVGSEPNKAQNWVRQNLPTLTSIDDVRSGSFGGVTYKIYGGKDARYLEIGERSE